MKPLKSSNLFGFHSRMTLIIQSYNRRLKAKFYGSPGRQIRPFLFLFPSLQDSPNCLLTLRGVEERHWRCLPPPPVRVHLLAPGGGCSRACCAVRPADDPIELPTRRIDPPGPRNQRQRTHALAERLGTAAATSQ